MLVQPQGLVPSARTAVATAVLGALLLLHGGMLCSKSVSGRLAADTFCLDLNTLSWIKLAPSQERAVGSSSINVPRASHRAVAVPSAAAVMLIGECCTKAVCCVTCFHGSVHNSYAASILHEDMLRFLAASILHTRCRKSCRFSVSFTA
jgi:hypothetical protein